MKPAALAVLDDPDAVYASSPLVRLEVVPKATFFGRDTEVAFYQEFFSPVSTWAAVEPILIDSAEGLAKKFGLSAIDTLQVAVALAVKAERFMTTERKSRPLHRVEGIEVVSIDPRD